jgi:hypothetical protein
MRSTEPHRLLLIADVGCDSEVIQTALSFRGLNSANVEVCLVAPARRHVQERLARSRSALADLGLDGYAWIGDPDPLVAIDDALHRYAADELVIVTDHHSNRFGRPREIAAVACKRYALPTLDVIPDGPGHHVVVAMEPVGALAA